ncbi:SpoVR family protein [Alicyclobacillus kakegawensis]|uniref:SpoVR family protein n=1 Tax=Alicyclobacillus kakegawensis TaxID=392012 RepID=UPI00082C28F7|nr:SpoVR family protein [Alicyclobacillus kakegawensis]
MNDAELKELERSIERIMEIADGFGLDYFPMRYEVCPSDVIYTFGAYGMPTRFNHWSFGKAFHRLKLEYDFGLSRIYELVINSNPSYAFLLDGNTLLQNKTVCAHVLGHSDFFKNNSAFAQTSRDMVERMAANAERVRRYELEYGRQRVEQVLDAGIALQQHVDASRHADAVRRERMRRLREDKRQRARSRTGPYDDLWRLGEESGGSGTESQAKHGVDQAGADAYARRSTQRMLVPERDLMLFLIDYSRVLEEWERDILSLLREEMLYFWPQLETKIMNEGWATYWHLRIMREMDLTDAEAVDFAQMHAGVVLPSRTTINPYQLGLAIWEDIEKRWNDPTEEERERFGREPSQGRDKMFEVRETETDVSFLRNYLTKDLIEDLDLYLYQKVGNEWKVVETDWEKVRDHLCASRVNGGIPAIWVEDGDYNNNGELYLKHGYEGVELDLKHVEKTLPYVHRLWGRGCHLETVVDDRAVLFSYDGRRVQRKFL